MHEEQFPIDQRIVGAALACIPAEWTSFEVKAEESGENSYRVSLVPKPPDHGVANPSDELLTVVRELYLLHRKHKTGMSKATYVIREAEGRWSFVSEYEYDD